jgi:hypothetical protein
MCYLLKLAFLANVINMVEVDFLFVYTQKTMSQILRFWYVRINVNRHTPSAYVFLL